MFRKSELRKPVTRLRKQYVYSSNCASICSFAPFFGANVQIKDKSNPSKALIYLNAGVFFVFSCFGKEGRWGKQGVTPYYNSKSTNPHNRDCNAEMFRMTSLCFRLQNALVEKSAQLGKFIFPVRKIYFPSWKVPKTQFGDV